MMTATESDVVNILRYMAAAWPRHELSESTIAVYVIHMLGLRLSAEVLLLAAMRLVDTSSFFPSVAEWRTEANQIQSDREFWKLTTNYREDGDPLPHRLPAGIEAMVLGANRQLKSGR